MKQAREERQERIESGWDQAALDQAAREGFACGVFEESEEDGVGVLEEFYPDETGEDLGSGPRTDDARDSSSAPTPGRRGLREKLEQKVGQSVGPGLSQAADQRVEVMGANWMSAPMDEPAFPPLS